MWAALSDHIVHCTEACPLPSECHAKRYLVFKLKSLIHRSTGLHFSNQSCIWVCQKP